MDYVVICHLFINIESASDFGLSQANHHWFLSSLSPAPTRAACLPRSVSSLPSGHQPALAGITAALQPACGSFQALWIILLEDWSLAIASELFYALKLGGVVFLFLRLWGICAVRCVFRSAAHQAAHASGNVLARDIVLVLLYISVSLISISFKRMTFAIGCPRCLKMS